MCTILDKTQLYISVQACNFVYKIGPFDFQCDDSGGDALLLSTPIPKMAKQIRFNLGSGHRSDSSDLMTPTPPPKEFKRMNSQRKTLRNTRCLSTVVTDKERAMIFQGQVDDFDGVTESPRAPTGFVKSMCKLYSENFGLRKAASCGPQKGTDLNR